MHDDLALLDARAERVMSQRIAPAIATPIAQASVTAHRVYDANGATGEPITWDIARDSDYLPFELPGKWGPTWGTTWFRLEVDVCAHEPGELELHVDLGWQDHSAGFQCEALARDESGRVIKGLHPRNHWIPVGDGAGTQVFYLEAASNPLLLDVIPFIPTADGDRATSSDAEGYEFRSAQLVRIHPEVRELYADLDVLTGLAKTMPPDSPRRWRMAHNINDAINVLDTEDILGTAAHARQLLAECELPADADAMLVSAVGHAHIDSAWLWPIRETRRKVARTLANICQLLDAGYDFPFALPAAQHLAWLEEDQPEVFARVAEWVSRGKIIPVGGMWVEPDAVLPGGEAMARQFLYGQRYFESRFGSRCTGMWLPDSFGYSGALPQIAKLAGANWFLTQKLSWNQVDTFPHNSFEWEGIDGTRLFTHFSAADSYNSDLSAEIVEFSARNYSEKGRGHSTLIPFGYGDGGGGPTREMIRRGDRMADLCGSPRVSFDHPDTFFARAMDELAQPEVWVGELYLELHRATATTQVETKRGNRSNESLLREAELWCTMAAVRGLADYPWDVLEQCWQTVLLGQFHDILPGTSIAWVHQEIVADHARIGDQLASLIDNAQRLLAGDGDGEVTFNSSPFARADVAALGAAPQSVSPLGTTSAADGGTDLANDYLRVHFDANGVITSIRDLTAERELVPPGAHSGLLHLLPDFPNAWDAWDTDRFQRTDPSVIDEFSVDSTGDTVTTQASFRDSTATLAWTLDGTALNVDVTVDWHEHDRLLKLVLPVDVHTDEARFETQFGHLRRPIHENTSWDANRFEVSLHRWLQVAEPGYGVALANDASYGCDLLRAPRAGGGSYVTIRPSLIRGPRYPDPNTDQGVHTFRFSLAPADTAVAAAEVGYRRNLTTRTVPGSPVAPLVTATGALVDSVKLAEDRSGDVIVRLYEPSGARTRASITADGDWRATSVDLLEDDLDVGLESTEEGWSVDLHPFQILSLRLRKS